MKLLWNTGKSKKLNQENMPIIKVKGVSKRYKIYQTPFDRLRDVLGLNSKFKEYDAVNEVSFNVLPGEFLGVVGKNGSGKSTLLKMIAGQLQPTKGSIEVNGRISLLQLGLGFDPELSGIGNIKHSRMLQNLSNDSEEIIEFVKDFSELGEFIDYPVKTYSSGMYSRLAFATAIAGDPDILIADEVLAVGDMSFSQKCLGKMREFKERGKTVVLVTHDVNAVKSFCDTALWLNEGELISVGSAISVSENFRNYMLYGVMNKGTFDDEVELNEIMTHEISGKVLDQENQDAIKDVPWILPNRDRQTLSSTKVEITKYCFKDTNTGNGLLVWKPGEEVEFQILLAVKEDFVFHSIGFTLHDEMGVIALHLNSNFFEGESFLAKKSLIYKLTFIFNAPPLKTGDYSISIGCSEGETGVLIELYNYDTCIHVEWGKSKVLDNQGGYVLVPEGRFQVENG